MKPVKFAVIGCGHIGKRHAEMIRRNPDAELCAVVDVLPREDLKLDGPDVPYFHSISDMLSSVPDCDVINIATPNGLHASQAMEVLEARKHVLIEKPIALTKYDAERIIFKALQVHKHVFAVMQNRYSPPSKWLKEVIASGKLGKIYLAQFNCYWNRDDRYYKKGGWHGTKDLDGGTLFTQFSHYVDLLYWLFGDITDIRGKFGNFSHHGLIDFEDTGVVTFDFKDGGMGSLSYSTSVYSSNLESTLTVIAEKGSVKLGGQYMDKVEVCKIHDYEMPKLPLTNPGNDYGAYKGSAANHNYVIENVVNVIHGNTSIATNALEGLKVVDIIERIYSQL